MGLAETIGSYRRIFGITEPVLHRVAHKFDALLD